MMKFGYSIPEKEQVGDDGEIVTTKREVKFDENTATPELLVKHIRILEAKGYDVNVSLKLKEAKD